MLMVAIMHSHSPRVHRGTAGVHTAGVRDSALLVSAEILHVLAGSHVWEITFSPSSQIDFQDRKTCFKLQLVLGQSCWRRELISMSENWLVIWLRSVLCCSPMVTLTLIIYLPLWGGLWLAGGEAFDWLLPWRTRTGPRVSRVLFYGTDPSFLCTHTHTHTLSLLHLSLLPSHQGSYCCSSAPFIPTQVHCGMVAVAVIVTVM